MATKIVTNVTTGETWEEELTAEELTWLPSDSEIEISRFRILENDKK